MPIIAAVQGYDLNIGVGQAQAIDVAGDRVQFISASDPFAVIELRPNFSQGNIVLRPGQGYRFSEQVQRWVVYNRGAVPLTGSLMIGTGDFFDQRISGDVNVLDNSKARTMAGDVFASYMFGQANPAEYPHVQLWNPVGSGVRAVVRRLSGSCQSAGLVVVNANVTPLATQFPARASSRYIGVGRVSKLEQRYQSSASFIGTSANLFAQSIPAGGVAQEAPTSPFVFEPGTGLIVRMENVTGVPILVNMDVEEVPI
ncbi:hypothetical protein [Cupriavidus nantongensis]